MCLLNLETIRLNFHMIHLNLIIIYLIYKVETAYDSGYTIYAEMFSDVILYIVSNDKKNKMVRFMHARKKKEFFVEYEYRSSTSCIGYILAITSNFGMKYWPNIGILYCYNILSILIRNISLFHFLCKTFLCDIFVIATFH